MDYRNLKKYKYQLRSEYSLQTKIISEKGVDTKFIKLTKSGFLTIKKGYAWDGASSIAIDTETFMRGSLVHDALYQLMRENHLDISTYRKKADKLLRQICLEDGMSKFRAWYAYKAVRLFGKSSATGR